MSDSRWHKVDDNCWHLLPYVDSVAQAAVVRVNQTRGMNPVWTATICRPMPGRRVGGSYSRAGTARKAVETALHPDG